MLHETNTKTKNAKHIIIEMKFNNFKNNMQLL